MLFSSILRSPSVDDELIMVTVSRLWLSKPGALGIQPTVSAKPSETGMKRLEAANSSADTQRNHSVVDHIIMLHARNGMTL